jgi:predicted RNA methylase
LPRVAKSVSKWLWSVVSLRFMPSSTISKPKLGNTRVTGKEQYYTPKDLALKLMNRVQKFVPDLENRTLLEPAGGTGSFIEAARTKGIKTILSFDIEPKHPAVSRGDFLEVALSLGNALTISNPPFGRNNALSIPFFNKAAKHSDYICFIVPRSWRKWSVINRLDNSFHLIHDEDIAIDYVDETGALISKKMRLATCFQIWEKRENLRSSVKVQDLGVIEKTTPELADVSLTIFGFGCGKVKTEFPKVANTTQLFIRLKHPQALSALQTVDFSRFYKSTAYTEALSLQEINYLLNEAIFGDPKLEEGN